MRRCVCVGAVRVRDPQLNTEGSASTALLASQLTSMASLSALVSSFNARITRLEQMLANTHWFNPNIPVYYWAVFSTYSQYGGWFLNNDASMVCCVTAAVH